MDAPLYTYRGRVVYVVDGDTVDVQLDLGFHITHRLRVRLLGVYAPELRRSDSSGHFARQWLEERIMGHDIVLVTEKDKTEKYGRYLATIFRDGVNICEAIVAAGHATTAA
jgi:micrococcal nuclease